MDEDYKEFKRLFFLTLQSNQFGEYIPEERVKQYFEQTQNRQFPSYVHAATHAMQNYTPSKGVTI